MRSTATDSVAEELCLSTSDDLVEKLATIGITASPVRDNPIGKINVEPNDFRALCRPGVYIFWKDEQALYVGKGCRVMNRMSNPNHGAVGRALRDCTSIEILFFVDELAAIRQESSLIADLQPTLNRRGLGSALNE